MGLRIYAGWGQYEPATDYMFGGWNTAADGSGTAYTASTPITGNVTLYAQWAATHRVTLDDNSEQLDTIMGSKGDLVESAMSARYSEDGPETAASVQPDFYTLPDTFTAIKGAGLGSKLPTLHLWIRLSSTNNWMYAGCKTTGWNTAKDGSGTAYTADTPVNGDVTLYAQWALQPCTVTLDGNKPASAAEDVWVGVMSGDAIPWNNKTLTVTSWDTMKNFFPILVLAKDPNTMSGEEYTADTPVTGDITLYAQWSSPSPRRRKPSRGQ